MPLYIWNGSQYVRVDDGAGNIQIKNVVYDANKDGIIDADKIASLTRDKITDFFSSPFWDNIPDKPDKFPPESHTHSVSDVTFNNSIAPTQDKTYDVGSQDYRFRNGWFAGNLGLGVIAEPGTTLTVDVIGEDNYVEVASDTEERVYDCEDTTYSDWTINDQTTFTENGVLTKVKVQFEAKSDEPNSDYSTGKVVFYENGVEKFSTGYLGGVTEYRTYSCEYYTFNTQADFELKVIGYYNPKNHVYVRNRYLWMKKMYLGIKAGR